MGIMKRRFFGKNNIGFIRNLEKSRIKILDRHVFTDISGQDILAQ